MQTNISEAARALPPVQQIIMMLDQVLAGSPTTQEEAAERVEAVRKLSELLSRVGIDAESLIRYGMPHRAAFAVYLAMITSGSPSPLLDVRRWRSLLRVPSSESDSEDDQGQIRRAPKEGVDHIPLLLNRWVENARLADILSWTPPTDEEWADISLEPAPSDDVTDPYLWLWQRNTLNDLDRWLTTSLHMEYRWQNRHDVGLFSDEALAGAGPATQLLNAVIAKRAVDPRTRNDDAMFWALQDAAVRYLQQEKYAEAVTLFEFHRQRFPEDSRAMNNLGFCTMPIDPSRALHWLQKAVHFGYVDIAINVYNQCCCLERLNRAGEALDKAESYWQRQRVPPVDTGFLWVPDADGWVLQGDGHPEEELAALAIRVSEALGLHDRTVRWQERLDSLRVPREPAT